MRSLVAIMATVSLAAGCSKPKPVQDCCNLEGQALPPSQQQVRHSPVEVSVHRLDLTAPVLPAELAGLPGLTDTYVTDDEIDYRYKLALPAAATDAQDLLIVAQHSSQFAGAAIVTAFARTGRTLAARPLSAASRVEAETFVRGLAATAAQEPLSAPSLWSTWVRMGMGQRNAVALLSANLDSDAMDQFSRLAVRDQEVLWRGLEELWVSAPTELESSLRTIFAAYDELADTRSKDFLPLAPLDTLAWRDVMQMLRARSELHAGQPASAEGLARLFAVRMALRAVTAPPALKSASFAWFEHRRQGALVFLETHAAVFAHLQGFLPCSTCDDPPVDATRGSLESAAFDPLAGDSVQNAWDGYRFGVTEHVAQLLLANNPAWESAWRASQDTAASPGGPLDVLLIELRALDTGATGEDIEPLINQFYTDVDQLLLDLIPAMPTETRHSLTLASFCGLVQAVQESNAN